jgi:hypothetical protein
LFHALPSSGGVLDQPFKVMILFEAISAAESERDILEEARRKREAKQSAGNRS